MSEKIEDTSPIFSSAISTLTEKTSVLEKPGPLKEKDPGQSKKAKPTPEKLTVQLDFARVSLPSEEKHVLFSPMHYEPGYAYPLLVWLHGPGNDERQITRILPLISMRNFVGIAPRGIEVPDSPSETSNLEAARAAVPDLVLRLDREKKKGIAYDWPQSEAGINDAEQSIFDCIGIAREKCHIAKNRIFLLGFDNGGTMALRIAMRYPQYFAGVVSLGGGMPGGQLPFRQWASIRDMPIFLTLGKDSPSYSPETARSDLNLYHTAGLSVSVRQYSCGQELLPEMLQDVNRWIMERVCGGPAVQA